MKAVIKYPELSDYEEIGPWVDYLLQYIEDFRAEDINSDEHLTPDIEFMANVLSYMLAWDKNYK